MKIKYLKIENILSIESAEIHFDDSGLILVEGWNHDLGRANGAGKTAIFNALSFALYDEIPRKITSSEILRRGSKAGLVTARIVSGEDVYEVTRTRPKGVRFQRNDQEITLTQCEWEKILKLSYEQFLISIYAAQRNDTRFLFLNDSGKKDFLLKLLNLDKFHDLKKQADDKVKLLNAEVLDVKGKINTSKSKIEAYQESIVDEREIRALMKTTDSDIKDLNQKIIVAQQVSKPDLSSYVNIETQILTKEKTISAAKATRSVLHTQYRKISSLVAEFSASDKCGECGSKIDLTQSKHIHNKEQEEIKGQLADLKAQIDAQDLIVSKENEIHNLKTKLNEKKSKELEAYNSAQSSINEAKRVLFQKENTAQNCALKLSQNEELNSKISVLTEGLAKYELILLEKSQNLEFYKTLSTICSPTGAQAYVLDSIIDSFNEKIPNFVDLVWPTASYQLNSYRENAKGDVTAKFSESLTIDGKEVSVGSLSGGELKALSLCIDFTVIDILQTNFGIALNPIILDEPFDGLDSVGKEIVIGLLEKLSRERQILVVDHGSEAKASFNKIIMVEKRNGISSVKVES